MDRLGSSSNTRLFFSLFARHVLAMTMRLFSFGASLVLLPFTVAEALSTLQLFVFPSTVQSLSLCAMYSYCIMSNQCNKEGAAGHKRPLEFESEAEQPLAFVISQESAADDDGHHGTASDKRQRTMEPDSPGVVSISSAMGYPSLPRRLNDVLEPVEWWKQKPVSAPATMEVTNNNKASSCFICQRPRHYQRQIQQEHEIKPSNSLLSYFPTTRISSGATAMCMDTKPAAVESFHKCSFCDRQACVSCTRQCERCQQKFCSLCSTADYSGPLERSFCLDCHAIETREADDNMHIE